MSEKCPHSQVRATLFSPRCPLVCGRASCTPNRRRLSIPQYQFCPEWRTTTYVLTMIWSLISDKYLVRMNPNYGGFKADAGQPIKHGHPRQSAYHLFPYAQAFFFQSMTPYCILWFRMLQFWHNFISGRKPFNSHNLLRLVAVFNLHRQIPRNAFYAHTHLFKVLSAP